MKAIDPTVSVMAALMGARGGKSKSPKKIEASRKSIKKARAVRLAKLKQLPR